MNQPEKHPHIPARNILERIVLGGSDGAMEGVALMSALNGAGLAYGTIAIAGVAFAIAGALSMFFSSYLGRRSELKSLEIDMARERMEIETEPEEEEAEMRTLLKEDGYSEQEAEVIMQRLLKDKDLWLREMLRRELRVNVEEAGSNPLEVLEFDWHRNVPMKPEYYDFDTGRWDFNWQGEAMDDYKAATYAPSVSSKFDFIDLQIIKELQMDANKSLKEISEKLQVNYKKLAWHHTTHVLARKILPAYAVNWMGTRYDYALEKVLHRKHRYFALDLFARNVNDLELMTLRHDLNRLPFLWSEAAGKNYYAEFAIPVDNVVEGLQYLGNTTAKMKERISLYPIDQTEAASFTIPYKLYDANAKGWAFNKSELIQRFEKLMIEISAGAH